MDIDELSDSIQGLNIRLSYIEKGIENTEKQLNRRLEGMNEFRETLKDQAGHFVTREHLDTKLRLMQGEINLIQKLIYIGIGAILMIELLLRMIYR